MSSTISSSEIQNNWEGGSKPLDASYGKLMMWFFIVSDALTFTGFLEPTTTFITPFPFMRYQRGD